MNENHHKPEGGSSKTFTRKEIKAVAKKLQNMGEGLSQGERELLGFLVARAESLSTEQKEEVIVIDKSIEEAAYAALEGFMDSRRVRTDFQFWRR